MRGIVAALAILFALFAQQVLAQSATTMIVMDGSGSMWGQIEGRPKLEIARETVEEVLGQIQEDQEIGLIAYGHREKGNCGDIELVVPPAAGTGAAISQAVNGMRFLGKTPLSDAVRQAADALLYTEEAATVVLVTDGLETCSADPCALAIELEQAGLNFTTHVIGLGLSETESAQISCLASGTGGRYFDAADADSLADALRESVTSAPVAETPPTQRTYFPGAAMMPDVALSPTGQTTGAPETSPAPFDFPADGSAEQCAAICTGDGQCAAWRYEPAGSNFVADARCFAYGASSEMDYHAYGIGEGWASGIKDGMLMLVRPYVPQELLPEASLDAPDAASAGQALTVDWTGPAAELDTIEVGLPGDGERWTYVYVVKGAPVELQMPGEPGEYELRYKFRDHFVIATRPISVVAAAVSMTAPDQVLAGSEIAIGWVGPDADYDNIQIAERGSDSYLSYAYVRDRNPVLLTVPDTPGFYELRYKLADTEVIAIRPIEVMPVDAALPQAQTVLLPVTLAADMGDMEFNVVWSAIPVPGQNLSPEAWALSEGTPDAVTADFLPGAYDVRGDAGDQVFAGRIEVKAGAENHFVIPYSAELSPAGEDEAQADGYVCNSSSPCSYEDPSGLSFALPSGWRADPPFFYETAGGVLADKPTVLFSDTNGQRTIELNPVRWLERNGVCSLSAAGELCVYGQPDGPALLAIATILPSMRFAPR